MNTRILMVACFAMEKPDAELIHFSEVANSLCHMGYHVTIYHLSLNGLPAIRSLLNPAIGFFEPFVNAPKTYAMFIKGGLTVPSFLHHLKDFNPDIIYSRLGIVSGLYVIATRVLMGRHIKIITEHNGWIGPEAISSGKPKPIAFIGKELQRWSAHASDLVITVSKGIKSYLISLGVKADKIAVIGNGTNIRHFYPVDVTPCYDVGFIGNFAKWQGLEWLIEAFAIVLSVKPEAKLAIAGSGPEESALREQINKLGIEKQVEMVGSVSYQDAPLFINQCRVCTAPFRPRGSWSDDKSLSPLKIRDYAACGKPIVASSVPGLEEIEVAGFGLLVPPGDISGLSKAIIRLLENQTLCAEMGKKAREYAQMHYSWDQITDQISHHIQAITPAKV